MSGVDGRDVGRIGGVVDGPVKLDGEARWSNGDDVVRPLRCDRHGVAGVQGELAIGLVVEDEADGWGKVNNGSRRRRSAYRFARGTCCAPQSDVFSSFSSELGATASLPTAFWQTAEMVGPNPLSHRVRVVLITGEPGSGKSTLGIELAAALRVPFLARDDVRGGLFFTAGSWSEQPAGVPSADETVEALLQMVETMARLGVSCVVEFVVRCGREHDLERLRAVAECVVLVTSSSSSRVRFARRSLGDRLLNRRQVLDLLGFRSIVDHVEDAMARMEQVRVEMRRDFDLPTLHINTDDGCEPGLDAIVEFVASPLPVAS